MVKIGRIAGSKSKLRNKVDMLIYSLQWTIETDK